MELTELKSRRTLTFWASRLLLHRKNVKRQEGFESLTLLRQLPLKCALALVMGELMETRWAGRYLLAALSNRSPAALPAAKLLDKLQPKELIISLPNFSRP